MERPRWLRIHLPIQETRVQSLDQEDPLEKEVVTHSSILAWRILWTEELGRCSPWGRWESDTTERLHFHFLLSCVGEWNGNPLQCSCLENPADGGAWWAAIPGVAQSRTWLKWLSSSITDSPCCILETHTKLYINYTSIKKLREKNSVFYQSVFVFHNPVLPTLLRR